jgi:hypothetical protein
MNEKKSDHLNPAPTSLGAAMRRARVEGAEQNEAVADLREAEIARLDLLHDAIRPAIEQSPAAIDLFDVGIAYGERPRLFIDMIGFVEMAHDRRTYRFMQDTRHGRVLIAENDRVDRLADSITSYIARRIVERERALASDWRSNSEAQGERTGAAARAGAVSAPSPEQNTPASGIVTRRRVLLRRTGEAFNFLLVTLGALTFCVLAGLAAYALWLTLGRALWSAWFG